MAQTDQESELLKRMYGAAHLEVRNGTFYWRRRVPKKILEGASNPFLTFCLRTHLPFEAEDLARRISRLSAHAFEFAKGGPMDMGTTMQRVLTELVRFEIAAADHARAVAPERSLEHAQNALQREHAIQDTLREALFLRQRDVAREPVKAAAARLGVIIDETTEDWRKLAYEAVRVLYDLSRERERREQGEFTEPSPYFSRALNGEASSQPTNTLQSSTSAYCPLPSAESEPLPPSVQVEEREAVETVSQSEAASPPTMTLLQAFVDYGNARNEGKQGKRPGERADHKAGESYKRNSYPNMMSTAKLVHDIIGSKPISALQKSDFTEAFSLLQRVPANHGKSSKETRSIREIVRDTDLVEERNMAAVRLQLKAKGASEGNIEAAEHQERISRLRVNTVYRHMQDTQRVLRFLMMRGELSENFMENVIWTKREKQRLEILQEDNSRKIWGDHLQELFKTPVFQGETSDVGDPMFWAPLISVHQGLRCEEILQLRVADIQAENGVDFFDIKVGSPNQQLKSPAATRRIPVHRNLIEIGFLDLVDLRKRQGEDRLFPHLTRGKNRKTLSENFSKDFTRFRQMHGVYEERIDFHSFRTQFNVELIRSRIDSEIRHLLLGHELDSVNLRHYGGPGHALAHLKQVVDGVEIDIS